jgi:hypothetical protein
MRAIYETLERAAPTTAPVLITGQSRPWATTPRRARRARGGGRTLLAERELEAGPPDRKDDGVLHHDLSDHPAVEQRDAGASEIANRDAVRPARACTKAPRPAN